MARKKNTVTQAVVDELMESCDIAVTTVFDKCTIVACKLPNGFVIVESSSCVDPANYDEDMGVDICMKNIERKVWELEGYLLQNKLYFDGVSFDDKADDTADGLECDGDCEHCDMFDGDDDDDVKGEKPKHTGNKKYDDDVKGEKPKHTGNKKYDDDEYWDKLIQTYNDYLDYLDDLARHSHKRRHREFNPYRNDYFNKVYC
mgnify:CR=1 FL=1